MGGSVMNDTELLEAAAKAAGMHVDMRSSVPHWLWVRETKPPGIYRGWNPLTDDGDALRLAVKLQIDLSMRGSCIQARSNGVWVTEVAYLDADPLAVTRRAIVRAAAEFGNK
jgi:hypothetical protein